MKSSSLVSKYIFLIIIESTLNSHDFHINNPTLPLIEDSWLTNISRVDWFF